MYNALCTMHLMHYVQSIMYYVHYGKTIIHYVWIIYIHHVLCWYIMYYVICIVPYRRVMNWLCTRSKFLWIIAWGAWCDRCVSVFPHSFHCYEFNQNGYVCVIGWLWRYQTKLCNSYTDYGHYGYYWWLWYS